MRHRLQCYINKCGLIWPCSYMCSTCPADQDEPFQTCWSRSCERARLTSFLVPSLLQWLLHNGQLALKCQDRKDLLEDPDLPGWIVWCLYLRAGFCTTEASSSLQSKASPTISSKWKFMESHEEQREEQDLWLGRHLWLPFHIWRSDQGDNVFDLVSSVAWGCILWQHFFIEKLFQNKSTPLDFISVQMGAWSEIWSQYYFTARKSVLPEKPLLK